MLVMDQHFVLQRLSTSILFSIVELEFSVVLKCLLFLGGIALFYASYSIRAGIYLKSLCSNPLSIDAVALTFDDGISPNYTPVVLDVLKRYNAKATFFLIGERAEAHPDLVRRIVAEGHTIGNHSYYHKWNFTIKSSSQLEIELAQCTTLLEKITGNKVNLFRPPFGVTNPNISLAVRKAKLQSIGWSIRSFDTIGQKNDKVLKRVIRRLAPGEVVLLHDDREGAPYLVEQLLIEINKKGWKAVTVNQLFNLV